MAERILRTASLVNLLQHHCLHELTLVQLSLECRLTRGSDIHRGFVAKEETNWAIAGLYSHAISQNRSIKRRMIDVYGSIVCELT